MEAIKHYTQLIMIQLIITKSYFSPKNMIRGDSPYQTMYDDQTLPTDVVVDTIPEV